MNAERWPASVCTASVRQNEPPPAGSWVRAVSTVSSRWPSIATRRLGHLYGAVTPRPGMGIVTYVCPEVAAVLFTLGDLLDQAPHGPKDRVLSVRWLKRVVPLAWAAADHPGELASIDSAGTVTVGVPPRSWAGVLTVCRLRSYDPVVCEAPLAG